MKNRTFLLILTVFVSFSSVISQNRPAVNTSGAQKANKRPAQSEEKKSPAKTEPDPDENTTNIPSIREEPTEISDDGEVLKIDTNLVTVPVKVSDRSNRFIAGLKKEDFKIYEDDAEQEITYFSNEEQPFTVALVLDMSYSSTFKISEIQAAANAFIAQLRPSDKVMVVSFAGEINVLSEPTNDREQLRSAIRQTEVASGTSLYEAVDFVIKKRFARIEGRKAIVLFTDGVDTTSRSVFSTDNISDASELDALIYPIQYNTYNDVQNIKNNPTAGIPGGMPTGVPNGGGYPRTNPVPLPFPPTSQPKSPLPFPLPLPTVGAGQPDSKGTRAEDYRNADEYLQELANRTGGKVYRTDTTGNLSTAFSNIADELRQTYSIGFYPNDVNKEKRRKLKVRVSRSGAIVRAKDSYSIKSNQKNSK